MVEMTDLPARPRRLLADECCPRAVVDKLRAAGHDVRYAAEIDHGAEDRALLSIALEEGRIVVTEDYDFGELLTRNRLASIGTIIIYLPRLKPAERAQRLVGVISDGSIRLEGAITILEARRVRQRRLAD
jgi:uncharacterized protein with PIN domain